MPNLRIVGLGSDTNPLSVGEGDAGMAHVTTRNNQGGAGVIP